MKIIAVDSGSAVVELSASEVLGLVGAINELQEAVKGWEMHARTGVVEAEHERMRLELGALFDAIKRAATS